MNDFDLTDFGPTYLDGNPAIKMVYTFVDKGTKIKNETYIAEKNSKLYTLVSEFPLVQYPTYQPIIQKMIDSFEIS